MTERTTQPDPRPHLLRRLHAIGRQKGLDHDLLSDVGCQAYQVASLADLTPKQLRDFIQRLDVRAADRPPIEDLPGPRVPASPRPRVCSRERRGRPREEGVVRMMTPKQRAFIETLRGQLHWNATTFRDWLKTHFEADSIEGLRTSERASKAINTLIGYARKKQRQSRGS